MPKDTLHSTDGSNDYMMAQFMNTIIKTPEQMNVEERGLFGDALIKAFLEWAPDPMTSILISQQEYLYSGPKGR